MRAALDTWDDIPKGMKRYLSNYGWHFNKSMCEYATSLMKKGGKRIDPITKDALDKMLNQHNVVIKDNVGYDYIFVANMCKADYYGSSIVDDKHFCLFIKDYIDDEDAMDGIPMRRWYATMVGNGVMVDWDEFL